MRGGTRFVLEKREPGPTEKKGHIRTKSFSANAVVVLSARGEGGSFSRVAVPDNM